MPTRLFRMLLRLYPAAYQAVFGREMIAVFERSLADASRKSAPVLAVFVVREVAGLVRGAIGEHHRALRVEPQPWWWSLDAPAAALLLYCLAVRVSMVLGIHGFFFPGTWVMTAVLGAYASWRLGRARWPAFSPRVCLKTGVYALICAVSIPAAARITEGAWRTFLLRYDTPFEYRLPGLQVVVDPQGRPRDLHVKSLTFSSTTVLSNGTVMAMVNSAEGWTPPYCLFGGLLTMAIALRARRTARPAGLA